MNHHRCTRCKEESYPRHKYRGGVFCDGCIKITRGFEPGNKGIFFKVGRLWGAIGDWFRDILKPEVTIPDSKVAERSRHAELKRLEQYARRLPSNLQGSNPQMH